MTTIMNTATLWSLYEIDINKKLYPLLSKNEEQKLFYKLGKLKNKDKNKEEYENIRNKLIFSNLGLVIKNAKIYKKYAHSLDLDDLVAEGLLALIKAVENFDYKKKIKFSTFATSYIKGILKREITNKDRMIRLPVNIYEKKGYKEDVKFFDDLVYKKKEEENDIVSYEPLVEDYFWDNKKKENLNLFVRQCIACLSKKEQKLLNETILNPNTVNQRVAKEKFNMKNAMLYNKLNKINTIL
ncbi:MAG: sigma-70 family RNA polymerase sigma factor, partial [Clostridiales Family XIII bacterium]|nr:sigma-70 family RNA polymerase sigma factor [Clostridiales Family XIII bacterium]